MLTWLKSEVVILPAFIAALISLGAAFGLHLTGEQIGAIGGISTIIAGVIGRSLSTPTSTAKAEIAVALATPPPA